jgi:hypothetical protein
MRSCVTTCQSTRKNIPEDLNLEQHRLENFKPNKSFESLSEELLKLCYCYTHYHQNCISNTRHPNDCRSYVHYGKTSRAHERDEKCLQVAR